jgi:hypothetical protein
MDERIKELYARSFTDEQGEYFDPERFAQLIVEECAQALWTEECHVSDLAVEEYNRNANKIKRHFGIEK